MLFSRIKFFSIALLTLSTGAAYAQASETFEKLGAENEIAIVKTIQGAPESAFDMLERASGNTLCHSYKIGPRVRYVCYQKKNLSSSQALAAYEKLDSNVIVVTYKPMRIGAMILEKSDDQGLLCRKSTPAGRPGASGSAVCFQRISF